MRFPTASHPLREGRAQNGAPRRAALRDRARRTGAWALLLPLAVVAGTGASCSAETAAPSPSTAVGRAGTTRAPLGTVRVDDRTRLAGFKEVTVTVVAADGTSRTFCLLLADTDALRQQGLMFVTDPALGGYDGMVFTFEADTDGGFWMKNTRLPLSIAYLRADGTTAATTDMEPCPDDAAACPTYPPGRPYRHAIEVPQGNLARLGISDGSRVSLGADACAPPPAAA